MLTVYISSESMYFLPMEIDKVCKGFAELQIRGGIEDNSKIIFLISQQKHML